MKKLIIAMYLATVSLAMGCSSCSSSTTVPPEPCPTATVEPTVTPTVEPEPSDTKMSKDGWSVTLPGDSWERKDVCEPDFCPEVFFSQQQSVMVVLATESYEGSFDEYVLMAIRGVRDGDGEIHGAKSVEINGTNFVLLKTAKGSSTFIWMWITSGNGQGVSFSCGGSDESAVEKVCSAVADTITHQ